MVDSQLAAIAQPQADALAGPCTDSLGRELRAGLQQPEKRIHPKFFYDKRGSSLFEAITRLDEYYPTRTEIHILSTYADEIARQAGAASVLIEPGAGNCAKVRYLLARLQPRMFLPMDIAGDFLRDTAAQLQREYPALPIRAIAGDFCRQMPLPLDMPAGRRVVFYPGSTLGNFEPNQAVDFLKRMKTTAGSDGALVIGVDLAKERCILRAAYNDRRGVTAAFNLNVLDHANRLLGSNFDSANFAHHADYNEARGRIEMHLVSQCRQRISAGSWSVELAEGERIHTENSYKYTPEGFRALAARAGLAVTGHWRDPQGWFSVNFLECDGSVPAIA